MSRAGRDDEREPVHRKSGDPVNYARLARESPTLQDFKRELSTRGVTSEASTDWQKAMTAWRAVEASGQRARNIGDATKPAAASKEVDWAALAHQFRHRSDYERYLVRELGLRPGTNEWEKASRDYDLKEHLDDQQRRPDRAPRRDPEERRAIERAEDRLIQVARECRTREEFDQYLRQELRYEPGSVKYETAMLAWAVFKRETEGF
jgi:hypothetical protein